MTKRDKEHNDKVLELIVQMDSIMYKHGFDDVVILKASIIAFLEGARWCFLNKEDTLKRCEEGVNAYFKNHVQNKAHKLGDK